MKYDEFTISECLELINETLFLPDIQRPFVWEESDIYLLYDSICRGYPINTVLFWSIKKETLQKEQWIKRLKFISKGYEKKSRKLYENDNEVDTSPIQRDNYYLAIDGQQRLTSLYLTLYGSYYIKLKRTLHNADLYYNIFSGVTEIDDGILYEFKFHPQKNDDVFTESIQDKKNGITVEKTWIRLKYIFSLEKLAEVPTTLKQKIKSHVGIEIDDKITNILFNLWANLRFEKLISYYKEQIQDYDTVLDIFTRTNSGGEKLKYSDLLFSFIKRNWDEARIKFSELLRLLNEGGRYSFDHDFILKTILFINAKEQEHLKYSTKNFTTEIIEDTRNTWDTKLVTAIKLTKDLLVTRFQLTHHKLITSNNALIPIIYFVYKFDKKGIGEEDDKLTTELQKSIQEWLLTSMITGVFGGQSDSVLSKAKKGLDESAKENFFPKNELFAKFNEVKPALTLKVTEEIISKASYNSIESSLILSLLYKNTIDLAPLLDNNRPQQDHIISQSELKKSSIPKESIDSIFNLRWVSSSDNRIKSDENFNDWSKRLGNTVRQRHFIPDGDWSAANFDDFLVERKKVFIKEILSEIKT